MIRDILFFVITMFVFTGYGCALKEAVAANPIKISGNYEFISVDMTIFGKFNTLPIKQGEASFDNPLRKFKVKFLDPILMKEFINIEGQFIVKGNKIELNLPDSKLKGTVKLYHKRRDTYLTITWEVPGDELYDWIFKKK